MTFDPTKPVVSTDMKTSNEELLANLVALQKGEHITDASEPSGKQEGYIWYDSTNNLFKSYNGSAWATHAVAQTDGSYFGAWASKSNNTEYTAATDGFVQAWATSGASGSTLDGYAGASSADTQRAHCAGGSSSAGTTLGITMPVRKGEVWKVTGANTVLWLPLGV